jgi:uncharacterized repeat protein (TIGR01451 family)
MFQTVGIAQSRQRVLAVLLASGGCLLGVTPALADGGDTQATATCVPSLPYADNGTTVSKVDDYDLPPDTADPTLTGTCATIATGAGPAGSLPRGAVYTGTGTGPDAVYRLDFPSGNPDTLTITMTPTGQDLGLVTYCNTVSSLLSDGLAVSDTGVSGGTETVTVGNITAGTSLYIVVDGYSAGATPPGPSAPYLLSITSSGSTQPTCAGAAADLAITKTDDVSTVFAGESTTYTIVATNNGPSAATAVNVDDTFPTACSFVSYTALGAGGATGFTASGSGTIAETAIDMPAGSSVTYTATCSIDPGASGTLDNTATISSAAITDGTPGNDSATDSDTIISASDLIFKDGFDTSAL